MRDTASCDRLEERLNLAAVAWTGAAGDGLWQTPANWSGLVVPGVTDDVTMNVAGDASIRFLAAAGSVAIASLSTFEPLVVEGGSLRVIGNAAIRSSAALLGGTFACDGVCTFESSLEWQGCTLAGAGTMTTRQTSLVTLGGIESHVLSTRFDLAGTMMFVGNPSIHFVSGTLNNLSTGVIHWTAAGNFLGISGTNALNNLGSLVKDGPVSGSVTVPLNNTGSIQIVTSPMLLFVPGTLGGSVDIAAAGSLALGGDFTYQTGLRLRGAGSLAISSGTHVFPAGTLLLTGQMTFDAGSITINNPIFPSNGIIVPTTTSLTLNADQSMATLQTGGTLSGSGRLTVTGSLIWSAGTITGTGSITIAAGATMTSSGNGRFLARSLENLGTATFQSPGTLFFSGATLTNSGLFTLNASVSNGAGSNLFVNRGTLQKGSTNSMTVTVPFNNQGSFAISAGSLTFTNLQNYVAASGSLTGGNWRISNGATVSISGAFITTLATGTSLTLEGVGSTLNPASGLSVNRGVLTLSNGRPFNFTSAGNVFHNHGTFEKSGAGSITIPASIVFNNYGAIRVTGGSLTVPGVLSAGGTLETSGTGMFVAGRAMSFGTITNGGTLDAGLFRISATAQYSQSALGTLRLSIASEVAFGQLACSGGCQLDGSLILDAVNGFDAAGNVPGLRAVLVDAATRSGSLSFVQLPPTAMGTYALVPTGPDLVLLFNFADANGDGGVDGSDIDTFFSLWESGSSFADVNGDGGVDGADIGVFFQQWEQGGPG